MGRIARLYPTGTCLSAKKRGYAVGVAAATLLCAAVWGALAAERHAKVVGATKDGFVHPLSGKLITPRKIFFPYLYRRPGYSMLVTPVGTMRLPYDADTIDAGLNAIGIAAAVVGLYVFWRVFKVCARLSGRVPCCPCYWVLAKRRREREAGTAAARPRAPRDRSAADPASKPGTAPGGGTESSVVYKTEGGPSQTSIRRRRTVVNQT